MFSYGPNTGCLKANFRRSSAVGYPTVLFPFCLLLYGRYFLTLGLSLPRTTVSWFEQHLAGFSSGSIPALVYLSTQSSFPSLGVAKVKFHFCFLAVLPPTHPPSLLPSALSPSSIRPLLTHSPRPLAHIRCPMFPSQPLPAWDAFSRLPPSPRDSRRPQAGSGQQLVLYPDAECPVQWSVDQPDDRAWGERHLQVSSLELCTVIFFKV